ncbi:MAG: putative dsRNA-binding protein [Candidatus Thorarchaeota archaeon]
MIPKSFNPILIFRIFFPALILVIIVAPLIGKANSKKLAEKNAAKMMCKILGLL